MAARESLSATQRAPPQPPPPPSRRRRPKVDGATTTRTSNGQSERRRHRATQQQTVQLSRLNGANGAYLGAQKHAIQPTGAQRLELQHKQKCRRRRRRRLIGRTCRGAEQNGSRAPLLSAGAVLAPAHERRLQRLQRQRRRRQQHQQQQQQQQPQTAQALSCKRRAPNELQTEPQVAMWPTTNNATQLAQTTIDAPEDQMRLVRDASRPFNLRWSKSDKSHECIVSEDQLEVCFHPKSSESSAAIRSCEPLRRNGNYYYWELKVFDKAYGTSVMFGVCTKQQLVHATDYCNLVGLDRTGWSLSHKGLVWHNGNSTQYMNPFPRDQSVILGILFNTMRGEISYFMDGKCLGVAFTDLNDFDDELYAVIGSTAKCTRIRLLGAFCGYNSLKERSCFTLLRNARDRNQLIETLYQSGIPNTLIGYIVDSSQVGQLTTGNIYCHQKQAECIFPTTETGYLTRNKLKSMR